MRVESVTLRKLHMRLKAPFETSFGVSFDRPVLLVELKADGVTGWSEVTAGEGPYFNSEFVSTAWVVLREILIPLVLGKSFAHASDIPIALAAIRGHEMARAGIECALWDRSEERRVGKECRSRWSPY